MSNTLYNYLDPDFKHSNAGDARLLLLIVDSHFSAAVLAGKQVLAWIENCPVTELQNPGELKELLNAGYNKVIVGIQTPKFTLWPQLVFEPEHTAAIARLLNVKAEDKVAHHQFDADNQVVYVVPEIQAAALQKYQWERQAVFAAQGWVKAIAENYPPAQNLYLNVNEQQLDILYLNEGKVRFYNHFNFYNEDEMVYYTLLAAQQLELDLTNTYVQVSGSVQPADRCISRMAEFFKGAEVNFMQLLEIPEAIPPQKMLALGALALCAS